MADIVNSLTGGVNLDISKDYQKSDSLRDAKNVRLLDTEGNAYNLSYFGGSLPLFKVNGVLTELRIPEGYNVLAAESFGIILILVINDGVNTQIGTFPSPKEGSDKLEYIYKPINNLYNSITDKAKEFTTDKLPYTLKSKLDIELQKDYDNSINIILTSEDIAPYIINTGFSYYSDGTYKIIDRGGLLNNDNDTNKYVEETLLEKIELSNSSFTPLNIEFLSIIRGGKLKVGKYNYYFKYANQEGNETDIIGQTLPIHIFKGQEAHTLEGGLPNEFSNKRLSFKLSNISPIYSNITVYFSYSTGKTEGITTFHKIKTSINIPDDSNVLVFTHNGREDIEDASIESIGIKSFNLSSAYTSIQAGNRLLLANVKSKITNLDSFRELALAYKPMIVSEDITTVRDPASFYKGKRQGYLNENNVYSKASYHSEEIYPFGVYFTLVDGSTTPVFPTTGLFPANLDHSNYKINASFTARKDTYIEDDNVGDLNRKGLVRFPRAYLTEVNSISHLGYIYGIRFKLINPDSYKGTLNKVQGIYFVRGNISDSRATRTQGYLMNTAPVLTQIQDFTGGEDMPHDSHPFVKKDGVSTANVPAPAFITESMYNFLSNPDNLKITYGVSSWVSLVISTTNTENNTSYLLKAMKTRFAFISPEVFNKTNTFIDLNEGYISCIETLDFIRAYPSNSEFKPVYSQFGSGETVQISDTPATPPYTALIIESTRKNNSKYTAKLKYIEAGSIAKDFTARVQFNNIIRNSNKTYSGCVFFHDSFNNYLAVTIGDGVDDTAPYINKIITIKEVADAGLGNNDLSLKALVEHRLQDNVLKENIKMIRCNIKNAPDLDDRLNHLSYSFNTRDFAQVDLGNINYVPIATTSLYKYMNEKFNTTPTLFGGDSYLETFVRRLNWNTNENADNRSYTGINVVGFVESWELPFARHKVDDTSTLGGIYNENTRLPLSAKGIGDTLSSGVNSEITSEINGTGLLWRSSGYSKETGDFNGGYTEDLPITKSSISSAQLSTESSWKTRIVYSERHIPNSFYNGFRTLIRSNYKDYNTKYGEIIKLHFLNNNIICIQEYGVGILPIDQRIQTGANSGGSIYVKDGSFIPTTMQMLSYLYGSQEKVHSISTDNYVYGVDLHKKVIWRTGGEGLELISDASIAAWLQSKLDHTTICNLGFNPITKDIYIVFSSSSGSLGTWVYSENINKFISLVDLESYTFSILLGELYILNKSIFEKYSSTESTLLGKKLEPEFTIIVNQEISRTKCFDILKIISTNVPPKSITFKTEDQEATVYVGLDPLTDEPIMRYRNKIWHIAVPIDEEAEEDIFNEVWGHEGRMTDRFMEVTIRYDAGAKINVNHVSTTIRLA